MSFHLFVSHLRFLSSASYSFQSTGLFFSLGMFIPKHFIYFDVMVNGIIPLMFLSDLLLLVYGNAVDFYGLILYPVTLPNSLMSSNSFLVESLGFSRYNVSSANSDSLFLPFQFGFLLFLFLL